MLLGCIAVNDHVSAEICVFLESLETEVAVERSYFVKELYMVGQLALTEM